LGWLARLKVKSSPLGWGHDLIYAADILFLAVCFSFDVAKEAPN
jgi:hypothetical protein